MRISFCCTNTKAGPWLDAFRRVLPGVEIDLWQSGAPEADYAVVWAPPQKFLNEQPKLKGVFNIGAGVDALLDLDLPRGAILVRIDDGGMAVQMAEFVSHAVIRHFREFDAYENEAAQMRWAFRRPRERKDFPVGIMGIGVLGQRVAAALSHFEFPVRGWSRSPKQVPGIECFAGPGELDAFLRGTRVLVCLLPLTADTVNIMNHQTLSRLMPGGYVINVARGAHLVDLDLLTLLDSGYLSGAALDVFRTEPLPAEHLFWRNPLITVTPHMSARTLRDESVAQIARKILAMERGEPVAGVVDVNRGY